MSRSAARRSLRAGVSLCLLMVLAGGATQAFAAKPPPKPPTLKASAVVAGFNATINYQLGGPASVIASQDCTLTFPNGLTGHVCDFTPNNGSGAKLTKFSISSSTPQAGSYSFAVQVNLVGGGHVNASTGFSVAPGPAVRFSVTGLVEQPAVCYVGIDCVGFPGPSFPRQIATIKALDTNGNVATGYAGTVTFENPVTHATPTGLQNMTLTNGVTYVPVLVPNLALWFEVEPEQSACPAGATGNGVVLAVTDTLDPSIFGCQNVAGGSSSIIFPSGFFDAPTSECPTGCFSEPTHNLTIDTNTVTPTSLSSTVLSDGSILLTGQTIANLYFTQSIDIGNLYLEGPAMPIGFFGPCIGCQDVNLLIGLAATPDAEVELGGNLLTISACVEFQWDTNACNQQGGHFAPVTTTVQDASIPTCYEDVGLITFVNISECD